MAWLSPGRPLVLRGIQKKLSALEQTGLSVGLGNQPCSQSISSDGTPITVSHRVAAELRSGTVYRRSGKLRGNSAILWTCCKSQRTALPHYEGCCAAQSFCELTATSHQARPFEGPLCEFICMHTCKEPGTPLHVHELCKHRQALCTPIMKCVHSLGLCAPP